jgi:hypothetical protein
MNFSICQTHTQVVVNRSINACSQQIVWLTANETLGVMHNMHKNPGNQVHFEQDMWGRLNMLRGDGCTEDIYHTLSFAHVQGTSMRSGQACHP